MKSVVSATCEVGWMFAMQGRLRSVLLRHVRSEVDGGGVACGV